VGNGVRGMVDVLAIRKDTSHSSHELLKSGHLLDTVLVRMKGGSARMPSGVEIRRLMAVARRYRAKEIILFAWKRATNCDFYKLTRKGACIECQGNIRMTADISMQGARQTASSSVARPILRECWAGLDQASHVKSRTSPVVNSRRA
jgi:hypothetical protein